MEQEIINNSAVAVEEKIVEKEKIIVKGGRAYAFFKRAFDLVASLFAILLLSWLLLILFIIQIFATKGHPVFADKRVGKNKKPISVYKFRSMYYDAETNIDKYLTPEQKEIWLRERKLDKDPRITKIGNFLRKTSLDELPQLFNILFGTMSVVGPRPITEKELENFNEDELKVLLSAKPGLTGYWQVYGRSDVDFESGERQRLELEYFSKRGFWFDIGLIFKTIPAVLKSKGAK